MSEGFPADGRPYGAWPTKDNVSGKPNETLVGARGGQNPSGQQGTNRPAGRGRGLSSKAAAAKSRGSKNHAKGACRPCIFHTQGRRCPQGNQCNFCHFEHGKEKYAECARYSASAALVKERRQAFPEQSPAGAYGAQVGDNSFEPWSNGYSWQERCYDSWQEEDGYSWQENGGQQSVVGNPVQFVRLSL